MKLSNYIFALSCDWSNSRYVIADVFFSGKSEISNWKICGVWYRPTSDQFVTEQTVVGMEYDMESSSSSRRPSPAPGETGTKFSSTTVLF